MLHQRNLDDVLIERQAAPGIPVMKKYSFTDCSEEQQQRYLDGLNRDELQALVLRFAKQLRQLGDDYNIVLPPRA